MDEDPMAQLAAALNGHEVTDEDGNITETETVDENTALDKKTTEDETQGETQTDTENQTQTEETKSDDEEHVAQDESGERYVPEKRFSKVYGKMKASEREASQAKQELEALKTKIAQGNEILTQNTGKKIEKPEKADLLEVELLKTTLPQFDPNSSKFSKELDELGGEIYRANPGITRMEAARRALDMAERLGAGITEAKSEARIVKSQQSDQGITNRVVSRQALQKQPSEMTETEMEEYLKQNGQW